MISLQYAYAICFVCLDCIAHMLPRGDPIRRDGGMMGRHDGMTEYSKTRNCETVKKGNF